LPTNCYNEIVIKKGGKRMSEVEYSRFSQYFIEIADHLKGLELEAEELLSEDKEIPQPLASEIYRHTVILEILTQAGEEMYSKNPKQLYQDGWDFWFKEDAELRELRYGRKEAKQC
jgi:hypothetical protein